MLIFYFLKYFGKIWKTTKLAHENKNLPKLCLIDFNKIWNLANFWEKVFNVCYWVCIGYLFKTSLLDKSLKECTIYAL